MNFQEVCARGGIALIITYLAASLPAGFLPPISPSSTPADTVQHFLSHRTGCLVAAPLFVCASMFYLAHSAVVSAQIQKIPGLHASIWIVQLAAGIIGSFLIMSFGLTLGVIVYRLDRPADITQTLNDLAMISLFLGWPPFLFQSWAFAFAIFSDHQQRPLFPKAVGTLNTFLPFFFIPATGVHCVVSGVVAWNGILTYWCAVVPRVLILLVNGFYVTKSFALDSEIGDRKIF